MATDHDMKQTHCHLTSQPFDTCSINFAIANKEYGGLIKFAKRASQPVKHLLAHFLYPLYVYIFLFLLGENRASEGHRFLSFYSKPFLNARGYESAIKELFEFQTLQAALSHPCFKCFCEKKYVVKNSGDILKIFLSYIEESQSKVLSTILSSHFHIKDANSGDCLEVKRIDVVPDVDVEPFIDRETTYNSEQVVEETQKHPSSYLYTISCRKERICAVDINSRNEFLACGFEDSSVHVWSLTSDCAMPKKNNDESVDKKLSSGDSDDFYSSDIATETGVHPSSAEILKGHHGSVFGLAFTPSYELLLSCSEDCSVRAWSMKSFKTLSVYLNHNYPVWDVAVSGNGAYFATASKDLTARLWCFERDRPLRIFAGHSSDVSCVKFHPNCRYVATASADRTICLWTVQDGHSVRKFSGHDTYISSITLCPNGQHLASADDNGCIKIWDIGCGQQITEFNAHTQRILSIAYNTNGTYLASGGFDSLLKIWDLQTCMDLKNSQNKRLKKFLPTELVDSHPTNSVVHFVGFRKQDLFVSVAVPHKKKSH